MLQALCAGPCAQHPDGALLRLRVMHSDLIKCPHKQHQVSQHLVWLIVTLRVSPAE